MGDMRPRRSSLLPVAKSFAPQLQFPLRDAFQQLLWRGHERKRFWFRSVGITRENIQTVSSTGDESTRFGDAQDELSITKSGTFIACAAHGLNILSCYADAAKPEPLSLMTSPEELLKGVTQRELQLRGERLRHWEERTSAWPHIAHQIGRALG